MDAVRIAVIGLGWWGGVLAEAVRATGMAELVACFARSTETREAFAARHGTRPVESLDALLANPQIDGVLIATPHSTHCDLIEQAASAGKHVFVEKPLTLTVDEAQRAIRATADAGVVLQVGHSRRRQPANRRIKAMIDSGELGTVLQLEGNQSAPAGHNPTFPAWRRDPSESPAGGMTGLGVHLVDDFQYFVGPAKRVFAISKQIDGPLAIDDTTTAVIEYESGPLGSIGTSCFAPAITDVSAIGTDAAVWNTEDGARLEVLRRGEPQRTPVDVDVIDVVADEVAEFASCIRSGARPETGGPEGLEVVAVLEAVVESARTGSPVGLTDVIGRSR